jgi:hypothetical protein
MHFLTCQSPPGHDKTKEKEASKLFSAPPFSFEVLCADLLANYGRPGLSTTV